jgi:hypothetical protein
VLYSHIHSLGTAIRSVSAFFIKFTTSFFDILEFSTKRERERELMLSWINWISRWRCHHFFKWSSHTHDVGKIIVLLLYLSVFCEGRITFYTIPIESSDSCEVDCVAAIVYFQFHSTYHTSQSCSKGRLRTHEIDREWCLQIAIHNRARHAKRPMAMIRAFERLCVAASYFRHRFPVICARPAGGSARYRARPSVRQRGVLSIQAGGGRLVRRRAPQHRR